MKVLIRCLKGKIRFFCSNLKMRKLVEWLHKFNGFFVIKFSLENQVPYGIIHKCCSNFPSFRAVKLRKRFKLSNCQKSAHTSILIFIKKKSNGIFHIQIALFCSLFCILVLKMKYVSSQPWNEEKLKISILKWIFYLLINVWGYILSV